MKLINEFGNVTMEISDTREIEKFIKDGWKIDEPKAEPSQVIKPAIEKKQNQSNTKKSPKKAVKKK